MSDFASFIQFLLILTLAVAAAIGGYYAGRTDSTPPHKVLGSTIRCGDPCTKCGADVAEGDGFITYLSKFERLCRSCYADLF